MLLSLAFVIAGSSARAQELTADQRVFRTLYEELVEIDTSLSGSCTRAAEAMLQHLRAAGYPEADATVIAPPGAPEQGNLVAVLRGTSRQRAILLLAHIDVVDVQREQWTRDPFTLVEENDFFYGRGTSDDKAMAAIFVELMVRLRRERFRARRSIKLALTCGEESAERVNGVEYLLANHRQWLESDFALNEGARGILSPDGRPLAVNVQFGEKTHQVFSLIATGPGGHSMRPLPENAIYRLSVALARFSQHQFPVELSPVTRAFFERMAPIVGGDTGAAMAALAEDPSDTSAAAIVGQDPTYNSMMRTTCVATEIQGGVAPNALPERATATLSCRLLPGSSPEAVQLEISRVLRDTGIEVAVVRRREGSMPPPLSREIIGPVERVAQRLWPGVPVIPTITLGATDGRILNSAGIPTYGMSGMLTIPGESNDHGSNERMRARSVYEGREFLNDVVRQYAR